ncbi:uncharacterized protein LOC124350825 isoform X1 [Daphnia pulicaria]|uniref:uncharacterized protein LOC124350825 isoform X1 n=1 Tax=Daphnia pulicaria TaxID=35523 RepID=UPI001EEA35E2|nr:uncharacterized protein LOC124350825 isoform X1 [Daphnia pulicaria]
MFFYYLKISPSKFKILSFETCQIDGVLIVSVMEWRFAVKRRKRERVVAVVQPTVNYFVQNHFILLDVSSKGYSLDWNNSSGLWGILTYTRVNLQTGWPVCPYERLKVTRNIT